MLKKVFLILILSVVSVHGMNNHNRQMTQGERFNQSIEDEKAKIKNNEYRAEYVAEGVTSLVRGQNDVLVMLAALSRQVDERFENIRAYP